MVVCARAWRSMVVVFFTLTPGCGGRSEADDSSTGGAATNAGGSAGMASGGAHTGGGAATTGTSTGGAASRPACSEIVDAFRPRPGQPCLKPGQSCVCDDELKSADCRDIAACVDELWSIEPASCAPPGPSSCPADPAGAHLTRCISAGQRCSLAEPYLACHCIEASLVDHYEFESCGARLSIWYCGEPSEPGCPLGVPEIGSACDQAGLLCGNACVNRLARECNGSVWIEAPRRGECV